MWYNKFGCRPLKGSIFVQLKQEERPKCLRFEFLLPTSFGVYLGIRLMIGPMLGSTILVCGTRVKNNFRPSGEHLSSRMKVGDFLLGNLEQSNSTARMHDFWFRRN